MSNIDTIASYTVSRTCDFEKELNSIRLKNGNRIIIGHLNINSIRNKFETIVNIIEKNIDIFMISETKIDNSFPK